MMRAQRAIAAAAMRSRLPHPDGCGMPTGWLAAPQPA